MIKITVTQTRPSVSIPFFGSDDPVITQEIRTYIAQYYIATGKLILDDRVVSEDGLTMTLTRLWEDQEAIDVFGSDQYIIDNVITPREAYMAQHGIVVTRVSEVV
jgi:hypothetical protein